MYLAEKERKKKRGKSNPLLILEAETIQGKEDKSDLNFITKPST